MKKTKAYKEAKAYKLGLCLLLPILVDGGTQWLDLRISSNLLRFTTGFLGGIGLALIIASVCFRIKNLLFHKRKGVIIPAMTKKKWA